MASRRGAALALVLLLIIALTGLGAGALALARRQAVAARTTASVLQAVLAGEGGLRAALEAWPGAADSLAPGTFTTISGVIGRGGRYRVDLHRLGRELFLARSEGRRDPDPARIRVAAPVWRLEPWTRVARAPAIVAHRGGLQLADGGSVQPFDPDPEDPSCVPAGLLEELGAVGLQVGGAALPGVLNSAWDDDGVLRPLEPVPEDPGRPGLGFLAFDSLLQAAWPLGPDLVPGPPPCEAPGSSACDPPGLVRLPPGARLDEGTIRGVTLVDGAVVLGGDAALEGWLLTTGDVLLTGSARVHGLVRSGGRVRVEGQAAVRGDPCAAASVLNTAWLRLPRPLPPEASPGADS